MPRNLFKRHLIVSLETTRVLGNFYRYYNILLLLKIFYAIF